MDNQDLKDHEKIEKKLLSIMSDFDSLMKDLMVLHEKNYKYAAAHLNKCSDLKSECKKILNKDFDSCARNQKLNELNKSELD